MRLIACGSRYFSDERYVREVLDALHAARPITCLIHGGSRGADGLAHGWARLREIDIMIFHAAWERYGKQAGPMRNQRMLDQGDPDCVLAFPGGTGTADMVKKAKREGIEVIEAKEIINHD